MKNSRHRWWVQAGPTEYLIHYRRGRIVRQGAGLGTWCLPAIDRCCLVPCTANSLSFTADQITQENQGVEVTGFAVWKVASPAATVQRFAFDGSSDPVQIIGTYLRDVVESAIRHRVANMTIDEVLRRRATIILELKRELAYITEHWGLEIDTIEIKNVRIQSAQVFAHLQSRYREALRMESETSALQTEQQIAAQRLRQKNQADADEAEREALAARAQLEQAQHALALAAQDHQVEVARRTADVSSLATEAGNRRRPDLALIDALPTALQFANVGEINLPPEMASACAKWLRGVLHHESCDRPIDPPNSSLRQGIGGGWKVKTEIRSTTNEHC